MSVEERGRLFGSSGVRGLVNAVLTPQLVCRVGLAAATYAKAKTVVVGRDTRLSGLMLEDALVAGLMAAGANVFALGVVPTPAVAYITKVLGAYIGFMLTASHNPPQYNGVKIFNRNSLSLTDHQQAAIEKIVIQNSYGLEQWRNIGSVYKVDRLDRYIRLLTNAAKLRKRWRVIADPGCGATFEAAPAALKAQNCRTTTLNAQPDGYFPARKSEPTKESVISLERTVRALDAEVGFAFDGDGDRVAFVDERGDFVDFDRALAAFASYVLKRSGGGVIVTNVEASMCVENMSEMYGGKVVRVRVGDVYLSQAMEHHGAIFGGEPCGAWIHPRFHWCPDGPLSAVLMLKALEDENVGLSEFISKVPQYITLRENLSCRNEQKHRILAQMETVLPHEFPDFKDFSKVDGVRLSLRNGWILIRASGTEPLIRLTVEGQSLKAARDILDRGVAIVKERIGEV